VVTSTKYSFWKMLTLKKKLVGFPHTDYVSSEKTRKLIDAAVKT
jgi:iron complex transport system substrate-binding protein